MKKTAYDQITIGKLLKKSRQDKHLSIAQISDITKINKKYIKAIEEENYSIFPSEVFLVGFIKNYASYVGVPKQRALALYRREREIEEAEQLTTAKKSPLAFQITVTPNKIISFFFIIVALSVFIYLGTYASTILREPSLALSSPINVSNKQTVDFTTDQETIELIGTHEIGTKIRVNDKEYDFLESEVFTIEQSLNKGINKFRIESETEFGKKTDLTLNVVFEEKKPIPTKSEITTEKITSISGEITVTQAEAYFEIIIEDELVHSTIEKRGFVFDFEKSAKVEFFIPDITSLELEINGTPFSITTPRFLIEIENDNLEVIDL